MLKALIAGSGSPEGIAALARGQLRRKRTELIEALTGGVEEHHRFLLAMQLGRIKAIEADVAALDARIAERLLPYGAEMALLMTIPGVNWLVAAVTRSASAAPLPISSAASNASAITSPSNPGPKPHNRTRSTDHFRGKSYKNGRWMGLSLVVETVDSVKDGAVESGRIGEGAI